jgi:uncharacterized protein
MDWQTAHDMKIIRLSLLFSLVLTLSAHAESLALKIGKKTIRPEIADTGETREHGLMQRDHLCADCGMLFVFPVAKQHGFWMKDTPQPLSIAFIARDGRIINIAEMRPFTFDVHYAEGNALYALEMRSGWFAGHGIKPGDEVEGLRLVPAAVR